VLEGSGGFELLAGQIRLLVWVAQEECVAIACSQGGGTQVADNPLPLAIAALQRAARSAGAVEEKVMLLTCGNKHRPFKEGLYLRRTDHELGAAFRLPADTLLLHVDIGDCTYGGC
jgi:hypothetical protein